jgi:hypothetical protein
VAILYGSGGLQMTLQRGVYKTTNAEFLDAAYHDPGQLDEPLRRLRGGQSLVERAEELEVAEDSDQLGLRQGSKDDLTRFIADEGPGTFEPTLRHGFEEAFDLARQQNKPIEAFWVIAPGDAFELHVCEGQHSIAVFFFVPPYKDREYGSYRASSRSWVFRVGDRTDVTADAPRTDLGDGVTQIQVSGPLADRA